jgi:hypothetical protein
MNPSAHRGFRVGAAGRAYIGVAQPEPAMWSVNVVLPFGIRLTLTSRLLWLVLSGVAMLLLWSYLAVLYSGLERGEQLRAEQRRAATNPAQKPAVRTVALAPPEAKL